NSQASVSIRNVTYPGNRSTRLHPMLQRVHWSMWYDPPSTITPASRARPRAARGLRHRVAAIDLRTHTGNTTAGTIHTQPTAYRFAPASQANPRANSHAIAPIAAR